MKRAKFDDLPLIPRIVAESVCSRPYTGQEWGPQLRDSRMVEQVEARRRQMTPEQVEEFASLSEARCRKAWESGAAWFRKCVRAEGDAGRDQLYAWITHWLAAYLATRGSALAVPAVPAT